MVEIHSKARIRWACRRGMLELDVLFMPFVE
ncbi:succinate dehydrogenase assembly factor 2, partial [Pseudoalteromonas sp. 45-MNA-CIBAN-0466]